MNKYSLSLKVRQSRNDIFKLNNRFFQKTNKQIQQYYYDTSGRLVFVLFLEETEDTKKIFQNQLTFNYSNIQTTTIDSNSSIYIYDKRGRDKSSLFPYVSPGLSFSGLDDAMIQTEKKMNKKICVSNYFYLG